MQIPCCQIEDCGAPLPTLHDRIYLQVRDGRNSKPRQIVVCQNCAKRLNGKENPDA